MRNETMKNGPHLKRHTFLLIIVVILIFLVLANKRGPKIADMAEITGEAVYLQ